MARQLCTFQIAGQLFGVDVAHVQEVIQDQATTRIPLAPSAVAGLINLRGQIVPVLDLRHCLALPRASAALGGANVVLATEAGPVSLRVDEIGDVLQVGDDAFEATPENLRGPTRALVRGVYKLDRALLLVLSTADVIELASSATPSPESDTSFALKN
ncbi:MAG: chemotaxis protein CheW [Myxococcales bacterium]